MATLVPVFPFNAMKDAKALAQAMKLPGIGTKEKAIIDILCYRSAAQRLEIVEAFKSDTGKNLRLKLEEELMGKEFVRILQALLTPPIDFLVKEIHEAVSRIGTDDHRRLVDILCPATNSELKQIKEAYRRHYKKELGKEIKGDAYGGFKALLVHVLQASRDDDYKVDEGGAIKEARRIFGAGQGRIKNDESAFIALLAQKSYAHIRIVMEEYKRLSGNSLENAVKAEFRRESAEFAMCAILSCAENKAAFLAKCVHQSMHPSAIVNHQELIRLIVSRSEIDLGNIRLQYQNLYKTPLAKAVETKVWGIGSTGHYRTVLLTLIG